MRKLRSRLTYANVMSTLAVVLVVAGGTAYAADTVFSTDIVDGQVKTADIGNNQVYAADVRDDTLANGGLTGADVKDQSGVDTCTHGSVRFGELCVRVPDLTQSWDGARDVCSAQGLRLPAFGEAMTLAQNHDIPGVNEGDFFWTDEITSDANGTWSAFTVSDAGLDGTDLIFGGSRETVCVTTPTN